MSDKNRLLNEETLKEADETLPGYSDLRKFCTDRIADVKERTLLILILDYCAMSEMDSYQTDDCLDAIAEILR